MCVILYKLFECGCKESKSVDPCPMMDKALDLVDVQGVPEDDPRIQRLEEKCGEKSAARYEIQSGNCDLCEATIAAVGRETWLVAKKMRDVNEENKFHVDIELQDSAARISRRNRRFPDDVIERLSPLSAKAVKVAGHPTGGNAIDLLDKKSDSGNSKDLEVALEAVLASRMDLDNCYDGKDLYAANDDSGGDRTTGIGGTTNKMIPRSGAPSPSLGHDSMDGGQSMSYKGKAN